MNINPNRDQTVKVSIATIDTPRNIDRRNGSIRGVILSAKQANLDKIFGLTQVVGDVSF